MPLEWHWLEKQFGGADGGAYSRLLDAHQPAHDLVAREVTQNSWDAASRHHREQLGGRDIEPGDSKKFKLVYDFREVSGSSRSRVLQALRVDQLREQLHANGHEKLRFPKSTTLLDDVDGSSPLKLLYISDFGATGLRGDPVGPKFDESDFFRAFGQIGGNDRDTGGGSFGFGKAAFIKASRIRCVLAYSSFMPTPEDGVTRRLWGFVYWHSFGRFSGVAQLGRLTQDQAPRSEPATDELADAIAEDFGFGSRSAGSYEDCGTSLLIVDHVLQPEQLRDALAKYWWPALETYQSTFDVSVRTDDEVLRPEPRLVESLSPYLRAFEIAAEPRPQLLQQEWRSNFQRLESSHLSVGSLGLVKIQPETPPVLDDGLHAHVALIRKPRMVVKYEAYPGSTPNTAVAGAFLASDDADGYLRMTEPSTHDEWTEAIDESYGRDWRTAAEVAAGVKSRVKRSVSDFQNSIRTKPKAKRSELSWANTLFDRLFSDSTDGGKKKRDPNGKGKKRKVRRRSGSYVTERVDRTLRIENENQVSVAEIWTVGLADAIKSSVEAQIQLHAWVVSDGDSVEPSDRLVIQSATAPPGFRILEGGLIAGVLSPGQSYEVTYVTEPFSRDWSLKSDVHIAGPQEAEQEGLGNEL